MFNSHFSVLLQRSDDGVALAVKRWCSAVRLMVDLLCLYLCHHRPNSQWGGTRQERLIQSQFNHFHLLASLSPTTVPPQEKRLLFIPVHLDIHWNLLMVVNTGITTKDRVPQWQILMMDSLPNPSTSTAGLVQQYLFRRWAKETGTTDVDSLAGVWPQFESIPIWTLRTPGQPNFCDCGVYMLHYLELCLGQKFQDDLRSTQLQDLVCPSCNLYPPSVRQCPNE